MPDICQTSKRVFSAQANILFQGEVPASAYCVNSGYVSSYTINANGEEQIIGFFEAGDVLPVEWLFNHSPVALYYYQAFTDVELLAVRRDDLMSAIKTNRQLTNEMLDRFVSSFIGTTIHIHALEHSHSREKLIKLFHYLVLRFGVLQAGKDKLYAIPFSLTHSQIASMIGLTRETVAIETSKLKKNNALDYKNGSYVINLPKLIETIGSEEFDALKL